MDALVRILGAVDIVQLPQRLDAAAAPALRQQVADMVQRGRVRLILDLSAVKSCDSSGLSVLVSALKAARAANGDVMLLRLSSPARTFIELTRLHQAFRIFEDEAAAVAAFAIGA